MSIRGHYTLCLFCDDRSCTSSSGRGPAEEFYAETKSEAVRKARRKGWIVNGRNDKAYCHIHAPKRRKIRR